MKLYEMAVEVTFCTAADCWDPPTRSHAQFNGCPRALVPMQVILVSAKVMANTVPLPSGCTMLRFFEFNSFTTGGVGTGMMVSPGNETSHIPAAKPPLPDHRPPSITGKVS